jgi:hypothetical protein
VQGSVIDVGANARLEDVVHSVLFLFIGDQMLDRGDDTNALDAFN